MDFHSRSLESGGRYCFQEQPAAALWACQRSGDALLPLHCTLPQQMASEVAQVFDTQFAAARDEGFRQKLGLKMADAKLVDDLVDLMKRTEADWTCTFRALSEADSPEQAVAQVARWCVTGS